MWKNKNVLSNCPSLYMFSLLHISSVGLHRHWVTWIAAFNKVSQQEQKLEESKSVIKPFGHVSGKTWTSIFRVRPFPRSSRPFPPFSVLWVFCFSMFFLVYLCSFHDNKFCCVHFRWLFEKDAANAKIQQTIPVRQHFVGNDSLADRLSHAKGDVTLLRFGIGFGKALHAQVLKSKQCPVSFTLRLFSQVAVPLEPLAAMQIGSISLCSAKAQGIPRTGSYIQKWNNRRILEARHYKCNYMTISSLSRCTINIPGIFWWREWEVC